MNPIERSSADENLVNELVPLLDRHWDTLERGGRIEAEAWVKLHPDGAIGMADLRVLQALHDAVAAVKEDSHAGSDVEPAGTEVINDPQLASTELCGAAGGAFSEVAVGGKIGKYEIREILGRGGQATTFKAWDPDTKRTVVVKAYHGAATAALSDAVLEEGQKLTKVRSPYVVQCYHVERLAGFHCLILEYVAGQSLSQLHTSKPPNVSKSLSLIAHVAEGLAAVHASGLLHRDIKPGNIVDGHDGIPKLLDFGLAKPLGDPTLGDVTGTFSYMAPEQARGDVDRVDPRTDIFGLGATLYFLLTGHAPYEGTRDEVRRAAREGNIVPPRQRNSKVPADVNRLCMRCLAQAPEQRFGSARDLMRAIRGRRSWQFGKVAAAVGVMLIVAVMAMIASRPGRNVASNPPQPSADVRSNQTKIESVEYLQIIQGKPGGLVLLDPYELRFGDGVRFSAKLSRPAYCFWLAFAPDGTEVNCFPLDADKAPPLTDSPALPSGSTYTLNDAIGTQVFVLLVSDTPLPSYRQWRKGMRDCPWRPVGEFEAAIRRHKGNEPRTIRLKELAGVRSIERQVLTSRLSDLVTWLQGTSEHPPTIDAWELPVVPREPKSVRPATSAPTQTPRAETASNTTKPATGKGDRVHERDHATKEGQSLHSSKKYKEAVERFHEALAIEQELFGESSAQAIEIWNLIVQAHESADDWQNATEASGTILRLTKTLYGEGHYKLVSAKLDLELVKTQSRLTAAQRQELVESRKLTRDAKDHFLRNNFKQAKEPAERALEIRTRVLGPRHFLTAISLNNSAMVCYQLGLYATARERYEEALSIREELLGVNHPETAGTLNSLATLCEDIGEYSRAKELYTKALDVRIRILGDKNTLTAVSRNNLGNFYRRLGNYNESRQLFEQAIESYTSAYGPEHPEIATTLNNLADVHRSLGDYAAAHKLLTQALDMRRKLLNAKQSFQIAVSANDLASLYKELGDDQRAMPLYLEALEARERVRGPNHTDTAQSLNNVALMHLRLGNPDKALEMLNKSLSVREAAFGPNHEQTATSLNNLAAVYQHQRAYDLARPLFKRALEIREAKLGPDHPATFESQNNLAGLLNEMEEYAEARRLFEDSLTRWLELFGIEHPITARFQSNLANSHTNLRDFAAATHLLRDALGIRMRHLERTSVVQSERSQLIAAREMHKDLDAYISLFLMDASLEGSPYDQVLGFKGAVLKRQRALRASLEQPELQATFDELQWTASQLTHLALRAPDRDESRRLRQQRLTELSLKKESLESELSQRSVHFRRSSTSVTLRQVQDLLPARTALVDLLEYERSMGPATSKGPLQAERRLAAFVVRPERDVALLDLGASKMFDEAVQDWRSSIGTGAAAERAGKLIREKLWLPLQDHLEGIDTLLISPDGAIASFPLAALPGAKENTYLLEEKMRIVIIPSAALLPELSQETEKREPASLLALGGVAYDRQGSQDSRAASNSPFRSRAITSDSTGMSFDYLEGSLGEVAALEKIFLELSHGSREGLTVLSKDLASETELRRRATGHRFLHLATHGYFAPESMQSSMQAATMPRMPPGNRTDEISGFHPGLLSGVALAGANRKGAPDGANDGILSAEEVATLNLDGVHLVTLSACETGLGKVAGGEGLLGLQRAFQVAGADTVVASLWKVPDQTTRLLMERFYRNLWVKRMDKLDALREAQLWILREGVELEDKERGIEKSGSQDAPAAKRVSPYFWAGFVLSGDWR